MSPEVFQTIVDAFRENGWTHSSYSHVGRIVGLDQRRISQAWREGFPGVGLPSILSIATEEMRTGVKWRHPSIKNELPVSPFQMPVNRLAPPAGAPWMAWPYRAWAASRPASERVGGV